ncbi:OB-fold nucleic acid binding domain-containing protein [Fodinicurvata halophila]
MTLEDETGTVNCVVWPDLLKRERTCILSASLLCVRGTVQKEGEVVHLIVREVEDFSGLLDRVPHCESEQTSDTGSADASREGQDPGKGRDRLRIRSRDFH